MKKRNFIAAGASLAALALVTTGCTTTSGSSGDPAAQRAAIDAAVDSALTRLYAHAQGSQQLVASAKGVLVFPSLESANIAYKLLSRLGNAMAIGPILLGMGAPVHVLQTGDDVNAIVQIASVAVMDVMGREEKISGKKVGKKK